MAAVDVDEVDRLEHLGWITSMGWQEFMRMERRRLNERCRKLRRAFRGSGCRTRTDEQARTYRRRRSAQEPTKGSWPSCEEDGRAFYR